MGKSKNISEFEKISDDKFKRVSLSELVSVYGGNSPTLISNSNIDFADENYNINYIQKISDELIFLGGEGYRF